MSMPMYSAETKLGKLRQRFEAMKHDTRATGFRALWKDLNDFLLPHKARFREDPHTPGTLKMDRVLDSHATLALRTMRSGMMSGITNPARPWFRLTTRDPEMNSYEPVKEWLYEVQQRMEWVFAQSNLYKILPSVFESIGAFGTSTILVLDDFEKLRRYQEFPLGSYYLAANEEGRIDTCFRDLQMSVRQVVRMFGLERCTTMVKDMWRNARFTEMVRVVHAIYPNEDRDTQSAYAKDKRFASCWWEEASPDNQFLRESGFDRYPLFHPRWETFDDSPYGYGPGADVLPDVKQLQKQQLQKLEGLEKIVKPPTQGPPGIHSIDTLPGGHTVIPIGSAEGIRPIYEVPIPLGDLREDMAATRERITRGLFEDVFIMLANLDRSQITAYEIAERKEEKLLRLGPVLQSVNDDLLNPLIDDAFASMLAKGLVPPAPREVQGQALQVEFISILHQAMRAVGISSVERLLTTASAVAPLWPDVVDKIDIDAVVDDLAERLGVPPKLVRGEEEVEPVRAQRQQMMQAAQMAQLAPDATQGMKNLSETETGGDTALSRVMGAAGLQ